jgi:hypothetical protein
LHGGGGGEGGETPPHGAGPVREGGRSQFQTAAATAVPHLTPEKKAPARDAPPVAGAAAAVATMPPQVPTTASIANAHAPASSPLGWERLTGSFST